MILAISCILLAWFIGVLLAIYNIKVLRETKEERLRIRREYKKIKNEQLKRKFNIK